ncbi:MAG: CPBP family intramembrane glutamic endopeptidase [Planctomycetota bacterium]
MPDTPRLLQLFDYAILGAGVAALIVAIVVISARRQWPNVLHLPPTYAHQFEGADVLMALVAVLYLPGLVNAITNPATTQPASSSSNIATLKQLTTIGATQAAAIAFLIVLARRRVTGGTAMWGLTLSRLTDRCAQAVAAIVLITPVCFALLEAVKWTLGVLNVESTTHASIVALQSPATPALIRAFTVFNALVLAAITEEMLFRGILLPAISRWTRSPWTAVLLTSALFGLIHYPYLDTIIPLTAFGLALGYIYARTGSLTLVILSHAVFNGKTLLWLLLGATA